MGSGHVLLAQPLNFGMGTALVFFNNKWSHVVSLWTKVLYNQQLKRSSAFNFLESDLAF